MVGHLIAAQRPSKFARLRLAATDEAEEGAQLIFLRRLDQNQRFDITGVVTERDRLPRASADPRPAERRDRYRIWVVEPKPGG